jgi:hypothetical protein
MRRMPRFDLEFDAQTQEAYRIVSAGETVHSRGGLLGKSEWPVKRIQSLYELAFLRVFAAWEQLLEDVFVYSLCGFKFRRGRRELLVSGAYYPKLTDATAAMLGGNRYLLWADPQKVIRRYNQFISRRPRGALGIQESVISSSAGELKQLAAVRHRIVHDQDDAKNNFDAATLHFASRTYPTSRPGRFLRDRDAATGQQWHDVLAGKLSRLAGQLV